MLVSISSVLTGLSMLGPRMCTLGFNLSVLTWFPRLQHRKCMLGFNLKCPHLASKASTQDVHAWFQSQCSHLVFNARTQDVHAWLQSQCPHLVSKASIQDVHAWFHSQCSHSVSKASTQDVHAWFHSQCSHLVSTAVDSGCVCLVSNLLFSLCFQGFNPVPRPVLLGWAMVPHFYLTQDQGNKDAVNTFCTAERGPRSSRLCSRCSVERGPRGLILRTLLCCLGKHSQTETGFKTNCLPMNGENCITSYCVVLSFKSAKLRWLVKKKRVFYSIGCILFMDDDTERKVDDVDDGGGLDFE